MWSLPHERPYPVSTCPWLNSWPTFPSFWWLTSSSQFILSTAGVPGCYTGHSFCIGTTISTASCGLPDHLTKMLSKWFQIRDLYTHSHHYYHGGSRPTHLTGITCTSFFFPSCFCRVPQDFGSSGPGLPPVLSPSFPLQTGMGSSKSPFSLEWGLIAGLWGFASHGGKILSRGWLAIVVAPGYSWHQRSTNRGSWLNSGIMSSEGSVQH